MEESVEVQGKDTPIHVTRANSGVVPVILHGAELPMVKLILDGAVVETDERVRLPSVLLTFPAAVALIQGLKARLEALDEWPSPLTPKLDYEVVKGLSQAAAQHMEKNIPQRFVAKSGGGNRVGKIFIDYLRNGHGQTTAAALSPWVDLACPACEAAVGQRALRASGSFMAITPTRGPGPFQSLATKLLPGHLTGPWLSRSGARRGANHREDRGHAHGQEGAVALPRGLHPSSN